MPGPEPTAAAVIAGAIAAECGRRSEERDIHFMLPASEEELAEAIIKALEAQGYSIGIRAVAPFEYICKAEGDGA